VNELNGKSAGSKATTPIVASGFFVLRTPLLPFDELVAWSEGVEASGDPVALARDRTLLRDRLGEIVERPQVREAIHVSSPALVGLIDGWAVDPESARGRQCERALVRFFSRMTARPTPFGLFAGVSTGMLDDETKLLLEGHARYRRTTRLDAGYLLEVVEGLLAEPGLRKRMTFRPNPCLYRVGDRRRYVRSRPGAEEQRHLLVSVRDSASLATALDAAASGATPAELAGRLVATGTDRDKAARFVDDLIEQQVLVPELELQVTGADATYGLAEAAPALAEARSALAALDRDPPGGPVERYRRIVSSLKPLPAEVNPDRVFQVDMTKPSPQATLGREVVKEILRGVELLHRIGSAGGDTSLRRFVERFRERFEGRSVPLLEALDPDLGVGFDEDDSPPAPLLADLRLTRPSRAGWGLREEHLLGRLLEVREAAELVLTARDLDALEQKDAPPLPDAFASMAVVAARSGTDMAAGRFRVLVSAADGPSGARLLGRFCHADHRLRSAVEKHVHAEEALDPEAVFAEIVHLPRGRDVNVVARPLLRQFELVCLGRSGAPPERQIQLDDLRVSVEDGRVVLRSERLGRRVVPRLTSAHNFSARGVAAYRFLCRLQGQGRIGGSGFWGPLASAPFLPRVRSGRVVLQRARWRVDADELGPAGDRDSDFRALQEWRRSRCVPRFLALADPGLELPVDLDNVLAVDSLVQAVRSRGIAELVELFPGPEELCVQGPEGRFVHELVVPFVRTRAPVPSTRRPTVTTVPRTFPPGSEWLYVRLYTGETAADRVLTAELAPLIREFTGSGAVHGWFFLRYRDPEFHLRVRFHGDPARLHGEVLPAVQAAGADLAARRFTWRIELGTYEREVERYGGPEAIEFAERAFHADSEAVLAILPTLEPGDEGQEERWRIGLAGAHQLLVDLGLDASERLTLARDQRETIARQLGWDNTARAPIGKRFRQERAALGRLLNPNTDEPSSLAPGLEILGERSRALQPIGDELARLDSEERLTTPRTSIAASLLHMHLNRLLRGNNTAQEAVIYDFLTRLYEAREQTAVALPEHKSQIAY
jgi:thiopeptide-type bacteriocin biosynthesis protein